MDADEIIEQQRVMIEAYGKVASHYLKMIREYWIVVASLEKELELATDLLEYHADQHLARLAREAEMSARADREKEVSNNLIADVWGTEGHQFTVALKVIDPDQIHHLIGMCKRGDLVAGCRIVRVDFNDSEDQAERLLKFAKEVRGEIDEIFNVGTVTAYQVFDVE